MISYPKPVPSWIEEAFKHKDKNCESVSKKYSSENANSGIFVAHCLNLSNLEIPRNCHRPKSYSKYGKVCDKRSIPLGSICIKSNSKGSKTFFAVAESRDGSTVYGLGYNKNNIISVSAYKLSDIEIVVYPIMEKRSLSLPIANHISEIGSV